ncbi:hypothetical protein [Ruegeria atlantica]|uniref:hypothetical protein n=1 Tax=Ruegeria atlantica TaxID=81569 RepID=UPI002494CE57|nr:hypothetical protein [Ruegeria atlantica]
MPAAQKIAINGAIKRRVRFLLILLASKPDLPKISQRVTVHQQVSSEESVMARLSGKSPQIWSVLVLRNVLIACSFLLAAAPVLAEGVTCVERLLGSDRSDIADDRFLGAMAKLTNAPETCDAILAQALDPDAGKIEETVGEKKGHCQSARETWSDVKSTKSAKVLRAFAEYYADCPIYRALAEAKLGQHPDNAFPESLGPFRIGEILSENDTFAEATIDGMQGYAEAITSANGAVTNIVFYDDSSQSLDEVLASAMRLRGTPAEDLSNKWLPRYSWDSDDGKRRLTIGMAEPCCGADYQLFLWLGVTDPKALCGPEDGFAPWLTALQSSIAQNDHAAIAAEFSYPFVRWEQVSNDPDIEFAENEQVSFRKAGQLASALSSNVSLEAIVAAVSEMNPGNAACSVVAPEGVQAGYTTYTDSLGGVQFERQDTGWKIGGTFYTP